MVKSKCPALNAKCMKCKKKGHFAKKCKEKAPQPPAGENSVSSQPSTSFSIGAVSSSDSNSRSTRWKVSLSVDQKEINFKMDSGADVTAVPYHLFRKLWRHRRLSPPDRILTRPDGSKLPVIGVASCVMTHKSETLKEDIYVVRQLEHSLLSLRACEELKLVLRLNNVKESISSVKPKEEYPALFAGLGKLDCPYSIKLQPNSSPYAIHAPRRIPIPLMDKVISKLDDMVKIGVIEPVDEATEWCAPLVVVPKPNGDILLCVDLSILNQSVQREFHPMPVVEHILGQLGSTKIFSKLDANYGFYQITLSPEYQKLTTFITPFGRFMFRRLPFGISFAPEHFQKRMEQILHGLRGVLLHIDDILVYGSTTAEHDSRLRAVLERIRVSGLTLNKDKCIFGVSSVNFLGHKIDQTGVKPDPQKITAINDMPAPTSVTEIRRFMGMVNYLGRSIHSFLWPWHLPPSKASRWQFKTCSVCFPNFNSSGNSLCPNRERSSGNSVGVRAFPGHCDGKGNPH